KVSLFNLCQNSLYVAVGEVDEVVEDKHEVLDSRSKLGVAHADRIHDDLLSRAARAVEDFGHFLDTTRDLQFGAENGANLGTDDILDVTQELWRGLAHRREAIYNLFLQLGRQA